WFLGFEDGLTAGFGFGEGLSAGFAVASGFGLRGFWSPFGVFASFFRIHFLPFSYDLPCRNRITQQILFKTRQPISRTTCQPARGQHAVLPMAKFFFM
ncbi:MAG TPA: hypothetical protein PLK28_21295, partial [Candidatus Rifleibacterium sp.]|nr:hypothetical protein [Candidatus Rifleibacterium sp.]